MAAGRGLREARTRTADDLSSLGLEPLADGDGRALLRIAAQERALRQAALQVSSPADEEGLLRAALKGVFSLVKADVVAVCLTSGDQADPRCRALGRGGAVRLLPADDAPVVALAVDALRQQKPRHFRAWQPPDGGQCAWAMVVPVSAQGSGLGALITGRDRPGRFRDEHVSLLSALSQHLALALLRLQDRSREERMARLGTEFVSMASHEIRTPLTALQGFTELLLSREVTSSVQRDWLRLMNQEATRLGKLVGEMLDLTRIEAGKVDLTLRPVQLDELVCRVVRILGREGQRVRLQAEEAPTVVADEDKLAQVLTNLVRNALDYSPAGRPVRVDVARDCLAQTCGGGGVAAWAAQPHAAGRCQPAASVAVRDQGIGMAHEELARAAQPFYRGDSSADLVPEGSGLGLAIARAILERHQGCLWAHSLLGQGSTFGFCLPARIASTTGGSDGYRSRR